MGGLSYFTTRHFLLAERETAAQTQALANALVVRSSLQAGDTQYADLLASLDVGTGSNSILIHRAKAYPSSLGISESSIPSRLREEVLLGTVATQTYAPKNQNQPQIAIGVPLPAVHAAYFEVFSLSDLGHTLRVLTLTLIAAGVATTLLGIALGRFASARSLHPLAGVSRAAVAIAGGDSDTRLQSTAADPDLVGLTSSFNTMVDQLQARIEREARFNSDVSHELRSPLTTLLASLEVLEADRDHLSPRTQRALQLLGDDVRRFQRMVGDLLEMSRADTGSVDVFLEAVDVAELVQRSVDNGVRSLGDDHVAPPVHIAPEARFLRVGVDKRRFERVMANLLENAANYGGGATAITVSTNGTASGDASEGPAAGTNGRGGQASGRPPHGRERPRGAEDAASEPDTVSITVDDAGPGISPEERAKVFERFYRGSAAGRRGTGTGSGLGLALVAEHMRLMHGEAWADATPAGGARFVVALPILKDDQEPTW
jgi:signal transduction histidine kinase